jgi:lambda repressor-like predicted transcriptional regulator
MGIVINHVVLRRELARRGWNASELARAARLSHATVSAACAARPVSPTSVKLIADALARAPVLANVDSLIL